MFEKKMFDIDLPGAETALAIREVKFPHPLETHVEGLSGQ